jgi:hypothetical protein
MAEWIDAGSKRKIRNKWGMAFPWATCEKIFSEVSYKVRILVTSRERGGQQKIIMELAFAIAFVFTLFLTN